MAEAAAEGQRRQVTVLFADMADFTPTAERIGEEAVFTLMRRVIERMSEAVHGHGGAVQNITGDGLMALFVAPVAIEEAPLKACRAALEIQHRMQAMEGDVEAEPGGIAMSEATQRLVDGFVGSTFAGEREIKGKSEPQRVHSLTGLKDAVSRFDVSVSRGLTELVGRQAELETLGRCWEEARAGALRIVDIVGEAGIGKSRLVHDFRRRLDDDVFYL